MRLTDPRFKWVPSAKTDITKTWRRHGFKPTTDSERAARQRKTEGCAEAPALPAVEMPKVLRFRRQK